MITPDDGIQSVVIPVNQMAYPTVDGKRYLRYRVVSENGQNVSAWTPVIPVTSLKISDILTYTPSDYKVVPDGQAMTITWKTPATIDLDTYDVYVSWSTDKSIWTDWFYVTTTKANNASATIPIAYISDNRSKKYARFWIQAPTVKKQVSEYTKLFDTSEIEASTLLVVGGGTAAG
jgi:hypothetical protein